MILPGTGSEGLAKRVASLLHRPVGRVEARSFPDGERYVRILDAVRGPAIVVQTTFPPQHLTELFLLLDAARRAGATTLTAVVPYLAYMRQDRVFQAGEALSAAVIAKSISALCDRVVTVDPHKPEVLKLFTVPSEAVRADGPIAQELKDRKVDVVLAPDAGAFERAASVAKLCGAAVDQLEKTRIDSQTVRMKPKTLDVAGKRVAIVDDIISTGSTMATAVGLLRQAGATTTYVVGVHGLFLANAEERLKKAGVEEILTTDTVQGPYSLVSVAGVLSEALAAKAIKTG